MSDAQHDNSLLSCPQDEHIPFLDFSFFPVSTEISALEKLDKTLEDMHAAFPYEDDDFGCDDRPGVISLSNESDESGNISSNLRTSSLPATSSVEQSSLIPPTAPCLFPPLSTPEALVGPSFSLPMAPCSVPPLTGILGGPLKKPKESKPKQFQEKKWSLRYKELLEYVKETGHAHVPHTYPKNQRLACWVKRQRRLYKQLVKGEQTAMTDERLKLLKDVGFIFDSHEINWREKLEALKEYRKKEGDCNVPSNYEDKQLAIWVKCQRRQYKLFWEGKTTAMSPERISELEKQGFEWEVRTNLTKKTKLDPEDVLPFQNPFQANLQQRMQPNFHPDMQHSTMPYPMPSVSIPGQGFSSIINTFS